MPVDRKRRQKGLRKMAAALRILDEQGIIPLPAPATLCHPDGTLIEFYKDSDGSFVWDYDGERENASD